MNRIRRIHPIRRAAGILAGLAGALLAFSALSPAVFALQVPPAGGLAGSPPVHTIVTGGMPGWQITLIAIAAGVFAAVVAVALDRAWAARRHQAAPAA
jgi:hypothetical protein